MFAFNILDTEIRGFMNKLLKEEIFDQFEVRGVEICSLTKFEITGILDKDFMAEQDKPERNYCKWSELRPYVFNIIKGSKRPKSMKIVFSLPANEAEALHPKASAFYLNITLEGTNILCTAISSEKNFTMDKSIDAVWDEYITRFLKANQIVVSTL